MTQIAIINLVAPVAQMVRNCPTTTLVQAYIDAVRQFCSKTRWLRTTIPGVTVAGTTIYSLGSDTYHEIIGIKAMSIAVDADNTEALTPSSIGFDPNLDSAAPEFYHYLPHGNFELSPPPDAAYDLTISGIIQPKRGQNSIDDTLPLKWEYVFRDGALAQLLEIPGMPWTNLQMAAQKRALFIDGINQGKSDEGAGYNAGAATTARSGGGNANLRTRIQVI